MTPWYKKTLFAVLPFAGTLCVAPLASADRYSDYGSRSGRYESQMSQRDLRSFQNYLDSHEETAQQLYRNPELLTDRRFIRNHEALNDWLESHPDAAQALQADPHRYLERGQGYSSRSTEDREALTRMSERDLRSFENFLDSNPETANRLYESPDLIKDRQFVRNRQSLDDWLANHPDGAEALRANPHKFLWRERNTNPADFLSQLFQKRH
ncbi:MAG TPA: hypothetical protein VGX03_02365 [Candidatus Binatia bacterium]|jgi:hypothetical protein|nr:hypothetical protein [Candidatus Binatia bacterium]